jgi:SNF2 family DNA or RNA helicase
LLLLLLLLLLFQVGLRCVKLDGSMSLEQRNRTIDEFTHNPGAAWRSLHTQVSIKSA